MISFFFLAGVGGVCGLVVAIIFKRQPLLVAIAISGVVGTVAQALLFGVGEAGTDYRQNGYSFIDAVEAGVGATILFGMSAPFTGGLPAAFFGYVCHRLFNHGNRKKPSV